MNGMDDQDPTTYSPRADDVTAASAWSSSPLGDPADGAEYHPYRPGDEHPQRDAADHVDRASRGWRRRLTIGQRARLTGRNGIARTHKPAERGPYGRLTAANLSVSPTLDE
jgi:hypothetical protein